MNRDFRDLLAEFNAQSVEYIIVGAHALYSFHLDFMFDNLKTHSISCLAAFAASNYYRRELWESRLA